MKNGLASIFYFIFCLGWMTSNCFGSESSVAQSSNLMRINDIYFENIRLSNADTFVGYTQVRSGFNFMAGQVETYAVVRAAMDTRSIWGSTPDVYNDNYLFTGMGVDYLNTFPGVRLTAQMGTSFDLSSKIHQGGFDYRVGSQSYHEIQWAEINLRNEIYTEALYLRRYGNFLGGVQLRTFYPLVHQRIGSNQLEIGPLINGVASIDSQGLDYNRYIELRLGARLALNGPIQLALSPYYAWGGRWSQPTNLPNYEDFRILLSGSVSL